jgi:hypothetical protein
MRQRAIGKNRNPKLFGFTLFAFLFALCFTVNAQQQAKIAKIGWLGEGGAGSGRELFPARPR